VREIIDTANRLATAKYEMAEATIEQLVHFMSG